METHPFAHIIETNRGYFLFASRPSSSEIFKIGVTVDITSDEPITKDELEDIIRPALDSRHIDDLSVERDDFYSLVTIKGNFNLNRPEL